MTRPTKFILPSEAVRPDLRKSHGFKRGDRVRLKDRHDIVGVVASLPEPDALVVKLGSHVLGNTMAVDLDPPRGGRAVSDVDDWELEN